MTQFWRNLSERERFLIMTAAALFSVLIAYVAVISPIANWRAEQHRALERAQGLYALIEQAAAQSTGRAAASGDIETPIRNAISQSAAEAGVNLVYVNVQPDGAVDATVALVDPDDLFAWLKAVEETSGVRVVSADIAREQSQTTLVRAQLTLARRSGA